MEPLLTSSYYFKIEDFLNIEENYSKAWFSRRTFFTPNGKKIFTGIFDTWAYTPFCKINQNYLLGVKHYNRARPETNEAGSAPIFGDGLYLFRQDGIKTLTDKTCLNQRLRPMKKYKSWYKNIKAIN